MTKTQITNYSLTYLAIAFSSISFFNFNEMNFAYLLVVLFIFFNKNGLKVDKGFLVFLITLSVIVFAQTVKFSYFPVITTIGTYVRFIVPYYLIKFVGKDFPKYYVNLIYYLTIISFFFYFSSIIYPPLVGILFRFADLVAVDFANAPRYQNFIIYTVEPFHEGVLRNAGFSWEPSSFSGFLNLALMFNSFITGKYINKKNIFFIVGIITTFSTAGYIVLAFFTNSYIVFFNKSKIKFILVPLILFLTIYAYFALDFLGNKIESQLEIAQGYSNVSRNRGRFGSGVVDLIDVVEEPIFGRGRNIQTRYKNLSNLSDIEMHRTNGITDFMIKYGILGFIVYFGMMFKSLNRMVIEYNFDKRFAFIGLITILLIGMSQTWFQHTIFIALIYYYMTFKRGFYENPNSISQ